MNNQIQQGDVILEEVDEIPAGATPRKSHIIREGEGHHVHEIEGEVELFEKDGVIYTKVVGPAQLVHRSVGGGAGEHKTIVKDNIPAGKIFRDRGVVEWDAYANEARRVQD